MDYSKLTKEQIIEGIKKEVVILHFASDKLKDDKEVILELVKENGEVLYYASERLRDDKEIVLAAVKGNGVAFAHVSLRLKDDKEIVLEAIKQDGVLLQFASERLWDDKDLLEILENANISFFFPSNKNWYDKRMDFLANLRRQEDRDFIESAITPNNKSSKKVKF